MAQLHDVVKKGSTNRSVSVRIIDSTDGTPETGVLWNTAGIDMWYRREGAVKTSITEATLAALTTAHSDGGFLHIGDGEYRLDLPDAAFATGAEHVDFGGTVTGMIVIGGRVRLVDVDVEDTVRLGLTALPNAAADAAGGLPISDAGGLDLDAKLAATNEVTAARMGALTDWIDGGRLDLIIDSLATTADLLDKVGAVDEAAAAGDPSATESVMQYVKQLVNILVGTAGVGTFPAEAAPANAVSLAEVLRAIHADVTGLNGDVMRGTDNAALDSVATEARLAELDAANLPTDIDAILVDTSDMQPKLGTPAADVSADIAAVKAETALIVADTNELQTDLADGGRLDLLVDAIKAKTDNLPSGFAKNVALAGLTFTMVDATDFATPETGLAITGEISQDGGAFAALTNAEAEIGSGVYSIDLTQAEMNADTITLKFTATGAAQRVIVIKTDA